MRIDKNSPIPAYYQLSSIIQKKIEEGEYRRGELIPSERELSESLNLSRMTVRQAISRLVNEGVLYREKGRGTFVSKSKIIQHNMMSFTESVRKRGLVPSARVLYFRKIFDREDIGCLLGLKQGEGMFNIKRLRLADKMPIAIEEAFIPARVCPNLEKWDRESSLYRMLEERYALRVHFMDNTIQSAIAEKDEKKLLKIPEGIPVLRISGIRYNQTGEKLFYEKDVYRSDLYDYQVRIFLNRE